MTLTNPGGLGTVASVPRLMKGQASIIATGSINFPVEFQHLPKERIAELGVAKVMTITSTYDHRVIQGAESGRFLNVVDGLLQGERRASTSASPTRSASATGAAAAAAAAAPAPQRATATATAPARGSDAPASSQARPTAPAPPRSCSSRVPRWSRCTATCCPSPRRSRCCPRRKIDVSEDQLASVAAAMALVKAHRTHGHLLANLDPLGSPPPGRPRAGARRPSG